jgi:hypothetical protein
MTPLSPLMIGVSAGAAVVAMVVGGLILGTAQDAGQIWRGVLIGLNSGLNLLIGWWLLGGLSYGVAVAAGLALIGYLSVVPPVAYSRIYHFILGWLSWLMPMSWPVHAIGLALLILSLIGFLILGLPFRIRTFQVTRFGWNWSEGTFFLVGGWVSNANYAQSGFNLGGFIFMHWNWAARVPWDIPSWDWLLEHETGHGLSLAAFGSIFHLVEAIDENLPVIGRGEKAPAEHIADSNAYPHRPGFIAQWGA